MVYTSDTEITKTSSKVKADIIGRYKNIQGQLVTRNISYKSFRGSLPSILNHTPRSAKVFQESGELYPHVPNIDIMSNEYKTKRTQGVISEDVKIGALETYQNDESVRQSVLHMVSYFVFKGTGSKKSEYECNAVIIKHRDGSHTFTSYDTDEEKLDYIRSIIEKCVISFRNKGMPSETVSACLPWVYTNADGKECGSIHIRLAHH